MNDDGDDDDDVGVVMDVVNVNENDLMNDYYLMLYVMVVVEALNDDENVDDHRRYSEQMMNVFYNGKNKIFEY